MFTFSIILPCLMAVYNEMPCHYMYFDIKSKWGTQLHNWIWVVESHHCLWATPLLQVIAYWFTEYKNCIVLLCFSVWGADKGFPDKTAVFKWWAEGKEEDTTSVTLTLLYSPLDQFVLWIVLKPSTPTMACGSHHKQIWHIHYLTQ